MQNILNTSSNETKLKDSKGKKTSKSSSSKTNKSKTENVEEQNNELQTTIKEEPIKENQNIIEETLTKQDEIIIDESLNINQIEDNEIDNLLKEIDIEKIIPIDDNIDEDLSSKDDTDTVNISTIYSKEELLKKYENIIESLAFINNAPLKSFEPTKDLVVQITKNSNKINKLMLQLNTNFNDFMLKECATSLKNKDSKLKKTKKIGNAANYAINKELSTYKEVLIFMKRPENTFVSKGNILQSINSFIKNEKNNNNTEIFVEGDNRKFNLIGDLKILFNFIRENMIERGDIKESDDFPKQLSYIDIMKYLKYCFPEVKNN
jgi:hypothetical protein